MLIIIASLIGLPKINTNDVPGRVDFWEREINRFANEGANFNILYSENEYKNNGHKADRTFRTIT